jgi:hypothetical protein
MALFGLDESIFTLSGEKIYSLPDAESLHVKEGHVGYEMQKEADLVAQNERMQIDIWKAKSILYDLLVEKGMIDLSKINKV